MKLYPLREVFIMAKMYQAFLYVRHIGLHTWHILTHRTCTTTLCGRDYFPSFTDEDIETQRNSESFCPGYTSIKWQTQDLSSGRLVPGTSLGHLISPLEDFSLSKDCSPPNLISPYSGCYTDPTLSLLYSLYSLLFSYLFHVFTCSLNT